jgi:ribosomal protein S18 acetylase RimI-like enzyme
MRGQRLFVRAIGASDRAAVRDFLARHSERHLDSPARGLLGKLVGDLVAVMSISVTAESIRIDDITVAKELRRKRIGRVMVTEALQLAKQIDRSSLEVDDGGPAIEFFRHVGFEQEGSRWVKRV